MALIPNLVRPTDDRMIAGVCAGIARYLKTDVSLVRAVMAIAVLVGGVGVWIYPVLWLLMPEQGSSVAGADKLVGQARQWKAASDAKKAQMAPSGQPQDAPTPQTQQPREVFNPYVDENGRPE